MVKVSWLSPTPWCLCGRTSAGMVLPDLHKLLYRAVVFCLLHQLSPLCSWWRSGRCGLSPLGCDQLLSSCFSDEQPWHTCHVRCPLHLNCSPTQGLHIRLYTWWLHTLHFTTNWLLGVAVVLGPSAMFTFTEMSWQALIALFIGCSWQALMDLYALKRASSEATRFPNARTYTSNNDFPALFFREAKWPSTSSGSTVAIVSHAKLKCPLVLLYGY